MGVVGAVATLFFPYNFVSTYPLTANTALVIFAIVKIWLSLGRSESVKFVARHTQNSNSLQINGCHDAELLGH